MKTPPIYIRIIIAIFNDSARWTPVMNCSGRFPQSNGVNYDK